jgi:hypothetical protein
MLGCEFYSSASGVGVNENNAAWLDCCHIHDCATDIQIAAGTTYIRALQSGGNFSGSPTPY